MNNHETILLDVLGMSCPSCVHHVQTALADLGGVAKVEVRLRDGSVRIEYDPAAVTLDILVEALREAGYDATPSAAA